MLSRVALGFLFVAGLPEQSLAQSWDRYKPGSLPAIIAQHEEAAKAVGSSSAPGWSISAEDFPTETRLRFTGEFRALTPESRGILERWQRGYGVDPKVLTLFATECRFIADTTSIWVAVQQPLEEPLKREAKSGQEITALTTFIGSHYAGAGITWLFLLNEFDASE